MKNIPEQSNLTDSKYKEILALFKKLNIDLSDLEEKFLRGSGSGGQKINKTSNAVYIKHIPSGLSVKYQKYRERSMNRILAFRGILEKLNLDTKKNKDIEKIRKQKKRRIRRKEG